MVTPYSQRDNQLAFGQSRSKENRIFASYQIEDITHALTPGLAHGCLTC